MLTLIHLYPRSMSTYGDRGNLVCLQQRCHWRGIEVEVVPVEVGEPIPSQADFYFFGGGQDAAQQAVGRDLAGHKGEQLRLDIENNVPLLAICGGYQLLGKAYHPSQGDSIPGLNIFPIETFASSERMIGNLIIQAYPELSLAKESTIVGYENHSGKTRFTTREAQALGTVTDGFGNNGEDKTEGCVYHSAVGCYLHGSVLPKNPHLADWFIKKARVHAGENSELSPLDDQLEWAVHHELVERFS